MLVALRALSRQPAMCVRNGEHLRVSHRGGGLWGSAHLLHPSRVHVGLNAWRVGWGRIYFPASSAGAIPDALDVLIHQKTAELEKVLCLRYCLPSTLGTSLACPGSRAMPSHRLRLLCPELLKAFALGFTGVSPLLETTTKGCATTACLMDCVCRLPCFDIV